MRRARVAELKGTSRQIVPLTGLSRGNCPRDGLYGGRIMNGTCFTCGYEESAQDGVQDFLSFMKEAMAVRGASYSNGPRL